MSESTNIKVSPSTWRRLNSLKRPGDTFDDVLQRVLDESDAESIEELQ